MTDAAHAKFAPSSASRWLVCNDSVNYPDEPRTDQFAEEQATFGTEVHEFLSTGLTQQIGSQLISWVRGCEKHSELRPIQISPMPHWTPKQRSDALLCIEEWFKHVPPHAEREVKLFSRRWPGLFFGTLDAVWVDDSGCVNIADLKTGLKDVNAKNNSQLKCYAYLASEKFPTAQTFRVMVVQPLRGYYGDDVFTRQQIEEFGEKIGRAIESTPVRVPGPHCEFCNARLHCDVLHGSLFKLLADAQKSGLWTSDHMKALNPSCG